MCQANLAAPRPSSLPPFPTLRPNLFSWVPGPPPQTGFRLGTAPGRAHRPQASRQALTAGPMGVVPPVDTDALVSTEGCVALQTGTLQVRARHKAAVEHAGLVVVLRRCQGMALGKEAVRRGLVTLWLHCPPLYSPPPGAPTWAALLEPGSACT